MCSTCGCDAKESVTIKKVEFTLAPVHGHSHTHEYDHFHAHPHSHEHTHDDHSHVRPHSHDHSHAAKTVVDLEQDILQHNDLLAERNRGYFEAKQILALNLVSSPGSGKTTLLEKTLVALKDELAFYAIEGDQQTTRDADRIAATGAPVVQINTGKGCHLNAEMVSMAIKKLKPQENSVLFIENVGNLVCPAMFDLGETARVVIISVTEGDDKPLKYPDMFHTSQLCIINKTDLLPYVNFSIENAKAYAKKVNSGLEFIELSSSTGEGMHIWFQWLKEKVHFSETV